jgi:hypothetical protein
MWAKEGHRRQGDERTQEDGRHREDKSWWRMDAGRVQRAVVGQVERTVRAQRTDTGRAHKVAAG